MENRIPSSRTYSSENKSSSNYSFNYNTTIVDLNPFKKQFQQEHDDAQTRISHIFYNPNLDKVEDQRTFRNNLINKKKFLINKNMRFYEPVKDAEMLVEFQTLRLRLHSGINYDKESTNVSKIVS